MLWSGRACRRRTGRRGRRRAVRHAGPAGRGVVVLSRGAGDRDQQERERDQGESATTAAGTSHGAIVGPRPDRRCELGGACDHRRATIPYPHLSPPEVGERTLRNRVVMGSMHTGLEDRPCALPAARGVRRRAGPGRGRADRHRRLLPQRPGLAAALRVRDDHPAAGGRHREVTDAVHAEGGAIALQVLHAGRYGYTPFSVSAVATQVADHPVQGRTRSRAQGVEQTITRLRATRPSWPSRRGTTGSRSWAPRAT